MQKIFYETIVVETVCTLCAQDFETDDEVKVKNRHIMFWRYSIRSKMRLETAAKIM